MRLFVSLEYQIASSSFQLVCESVVQLLQKQVAQIFFSIACSQSYTLFDLVGSNKSQLSEILLLAILSYFKYIFREKAKGRGCSGEKFVSILRDSAHYKWRNLLGGLWWPLDSTLSKPDLKTIRLFYWHVLRLSYKSNSLFVYEHFFDPPKESISASFCVNVPHVELGGNCFRAGDFVIRENKVRSLMNKGLFYMIDSIYKSSCFKFECANICIVKDYFSFDDIEFPDLENKESLSNIQG